MSLISRITTWVSAQVLTASALNGEFNNIVNLINNIDAGTTNFSNCNSTASTITTATVTSLSNRLQKYRKPSLQYSSGTVAILETGINGTSGQLGILFPDGTYRTDSTAGRIQCNFAQTASLTGTAQSGIRSGSVANNTWYAVYAVKSQVNTTDIVAVADTTLPVQASFATLNTNFGTDSWVYIGMARYGDNSGTANAILKFVQQGNFTMFYNAATTNVDSGTAPGIRLATTAGAATLTYTYAAGTGAAQIPAHISNLCVFQGAINPSTSASVRAKDTPGNNLARAGHGGDVSYLPFIAPATNDIVLSNNTGESRPYDIMLNGFYDGVLGLGANVQL